MRFRESVCLFALVVLIASAALAQVNTVDLTVTVFDPSDASIKGAKVTVKNVATSASRSSESDETGRALFVSLPPGRYQITVEATGFSRLVNPELVLTIGQAAEFHAHMKIQSGVDTVTVTETTELIEVKRTGVAETIDARQIENLPINGRNYINFTLTNSQAARDSAPSIGAAPTSGINFGGARARSNQVSVDGADATDNSINGVRATVSQEAVQEFQVIMSNYMPEFGRATGGVINIVTKGGGNDVHGNVFGFLRHKSIQARNPFSVEIDPVTGVANPIKQAYTRFQGGATLGGAIKKDKTFYFLSYETTRRQETGFTNIGANNFGLVPVTNATNPFVPAGLTLLMTPAQNACVAGTLAGCAAIPAPIRATFAVIAGAASNAATLADLTAPVATALGYPVVLTGSRLFPLPVSGTPAPLPASFVSLNSLRGNYPVKEGTSLWSARLDHQWNDKNNSFVRVNVTPSLVTGIQVNAQNQNFGQNAGSRTSLNQVRDLAIVGQHVTAFTPRLFNEARFQFSRRGLHYGYSQLPGGSDIAVNIPGFAFFGREPFSTVDRIERRWQWTDNMTWTKGRHTIKFGGDVNLIQVRSKKVQVFELNFGGLYNFGAIDASPIVSAATGVPTTVPSSASFSAVQAYGLGIPQVYIQGIGTSALPFNNTALAGFAQDSWKVHPRLTLNYGVRYDVELTPLFPSPTPMNAAVEKAYNILEGIPRDKNNWSPRFALAWDPMGNGNTLVRAGYGIFFDHPLLAIAFNSATSEGAHSVQLVSFGGTPSRTSVLTPPFAALNGSSIFQGVLNAPSNFGYLPAEQRFDSKLAGSIFVDQNYIAAGIPLPALPFTLHVAKDFRYGYAQQANLTVEQKLWKDYKLSVSYTYTHGTKLYRPRNINQTDGGILVRNFRNAIAIGQVPSSPLSVSAPTFTSLPTATVCGATVISVGVLAALNCAGVVGPNAGLTGFVGTPAVFNFFRPSGPNPSFAGPGAVNYPSLIALATFCLPPALTVCANYPTGKPGVPVPFSDIDQQESSGNSVYHGLTVNFSKRFSHNFEFLSSWTWSHAIDDSTDLQTLLTPQDNNRPDLDRGNSTFDQRHRWVTSLVYQSPWKRSDPSGWHKLFADFTVAPIIEWATGRPFNVLTGTDFSLGFDSNTDRPSIVASGGVPSFFLPQANTFIPPTNCPIDPLTGNRTNTIFAGLPVPSFLGCTGNLARNAFYRPGFFQSDLRVSRKIHFGERWNMDLIADMFNLTNRNNVGDVNPLCNPTDPSSCRAGEPTAALDPRQFQFGIKINW